MNLDNVGVWNGHGDRVVPCSQSRGQDPRPRLVFLLGNGFTLDAIQHIAKISGQLNITDTLRARVDDLLPADTSVQYHSLHGNNDQFDTGVLWDPKIWPQLVSAFAKRDCQSAMDFFKEVAVQESQNRGSAVGEWEVKFGTLQHELRSYLWYYFYDFTLKLRKYYKCLSRWEWLSMIGFACRSCSVSVVSLNYDLLADDLICSLVKQRAVPAQATCSLVEKKYHSVEQLGKDIIPVVKLHGCVSHHKEISPIYQPNSWLQAGSMKGCYVQGSTKYCADFPQPPQPPQMPDLVPPGQGWRTLLDKSNWTHEYVQQLLQSADIVVSTGISAADPDAEEMERVLGYMRDSSKMYNVVVKEDGANLFSKQCESMCRGYESVKREELQGFIRKLFG